MGIREEIVRGLLKNINESFGTANERYLNDHIKNFCLFVDALRTEAIVENNAKNPVGSFGFRYLEHEKNPLKSIEDYISESRKTCYGYKLRGGKMKTKIDETFCYVALPANAETLYYDAKDILLMDEICFYTGPEPDSLDKYPKGQLLCRCSFGKSAPILADGRANCYVCLKDGHPVYFGTIGANDDCAIRLNLASIWFTKEASFTMESAPVYLKVHLKTYEVTHTKHQNKIFGKHND